MTGQSTSSEKKGGGEEVVIDLPFKNLTKSDLLGALFVHSPTDMSTQDAVNKMQIWILDFVEEQVAELKKYDDIPEEVIDELRAKHKVFSPITLSLYLQHLQMKEFESLSNADKERRLLARFPDMFKARFKGNASCRHARERLPEDDDEKQLAQGTPQNRKGISIFEFLKEFGDEIRKELNKH